MKNGTKGSKRLMAFVLSVIMLLTSASVVFSIDDPQLLLYDGFLLANGERPEDGAFIADLVTGELKDYAWSGAWHNNANDDESRAKIVDTEIDLNTVPLVYGDLAATGVILDVGTSNTNWKINPTRSVKNLNQGAWDALSIDHPLYDYFGWHDDSADVGAVENETLWFSTLVRRNGGGEIGLTEDGYVMFTSDKMNRRELFSIGYFGDKTNCSDEYDRYLGIGTAKKWGIRYATQLNANHVGAERFQYSPPGTGEPEYAYNASAKDVVDGETVLIIAKFEFNVTTGGAVTV